MMTTFLKLLIYNHQAYAYLSEVNNADYLRTYFMRFYGGGYTDVKMHRGSWVSSFEKLNLNEHALISCH